MAIVVMIIIGLVLLWGAWRLLRGQHAGTRQAAVPAASAPTPAAAPAAPATAPAATTPAATASPAPPPGASNSGVLHEELPVIAHSARESVHGRFNVLVRVVVNRSGAVVDESFDDTGPSRYFARQSALAARQWRFVPSDEHGPRLWLLRFEYSRDQVTAHAEPVTSP